MVSLKNEFAHNRLQKFAARRRNISFLDNITMALELPIYLNENSKVTRHASEICLVKAQSNPNIQGLASKLPMGMSQGLCVAIV